MVMVSGLLVGILMPLKILRRGRGERIGVEIQRLLFILLLIVILLIFLVKANLLIVLVGMVILRVDFIDFLFQMLLCKGEV